MAAQPNAREKIFTYKHLICIAALGVALATVGATQFASADESWADDLDCSLCHAEEVEEIEQTTHAIVDCTVCHDDDEVLAELHEEADADTALPTKLKKTSVDDGVCLECHGDGGIAAPSAESDGEDAEVADADAEAADTDATVEDEDDAAAPSDAKDDAKTEGADADKAAKADDTDAEDADADEDADEDADADDEEEALPEKTQLIAATADSEALTDSKGTVVNPHELPDTNNHNKIACVDCHKIHDSETDVAKTASKKCTSCHHENVYECYTCHS